MLGLRLQPGFLRLEGLETFSENLFSFLQKLAAFLRIQLPLDPLLGDLGDGGRAGPQRARTDRALSP